MRSAILLAIVISLVAISPGQTWAADNGEGIKKVDSAFKAEEKQNLDLFKGAIDLSVYTIIVFLILFTLLRLFAWKPIMEGLDKREKDLAQGKIDADNAKKEAKELREKLEQQLAKANDEIRVMMDKARQDAQATAAEELARGKAELQAERERQQRELRVSSDAALKEIWQQAAQLATLISSKAIRKSLSMDEHRALLDEALKEFRAAATTRRSDIESART